MSARRYREAAALARAQSAAAAQPADRGFWLTREAAAVSRSGDHESALKTARRALEANAADPYAVYASAEALAGLGRHQEAIAHFEEASREPRLRKGAQRRILEALKASRRWEELLPRVEGAGLDRADAFDFRAAALAGLGRMEEALTACRDCLKISPHHPPALWQSVEIEVEADGLDTVLDRYRRLSRIPSLPPVYREIHASLARKAGKDDEALRQYEALGSQGQRVQRRHAFALAKSGHEAEAIPLMEELLRADPHDLYLHSSYGAACRRTGVIERAVNFYNTLISLHPDEKTLYGRVARLRRALEST